MRVARQIEQMNNEGRIKDAREHATHLVTIQQDLHSYTTRMVHAQQLETQIRRAAAAHVEADVLRQTTCLMQDLSVSLPIEMKTMVAEFTDAMRLMDQASTEVVDAVGKANERPVTEQQVDAVLDAVTKLNAANTNSVYGLRVEQISTRDFSSIDSRIKALFAPWETNDNTT